MSGNSLDLTSYLFWKIVKIVSIHKYLWKWRQFVCEIFLPSTHLNLLKEKYLQMNSP